MKRIIFCTILALVLLIGACNPTPEPTVDSDDSVQDDDNEDIQDMPNEMPEESDAAEDVPVADRPDVTQLVDREFCQSIATEAEMKSLTGYGQPMFLRSVQTKFPPGASCIWSIPLDGGAGCSGVSEADMREGRCVRARIKANFNCDTEGSFGSSAQEWVSNSMILGGEKVDIGDIGKVDDRSHFDDTQYGVDFAQSGCHISISNPGGFEELKMESKETMLDIARRASKAFP